MLLTSAPRRGASARPYQLPFLAFLALLLIGLAACSTPQRESFSPPQSPNDDNQYRLVTLDNGLKALLISDPDASKAAASLDVQVGSGDNPRGRGGLAHFLEHMLFLGTAKYPDPAEYERYITEHGGSRNAYTSFEHTNYFFDVDAEFLPEALDRFAQFFIAPNFDATYVERERNAVQAEYQMSLNNDSRRWLDVLQTNMNPDHPFSQFSVGSLESLADRPGAPVRQDLIDFYERYYSANIMRLVVLGSEPLDELEVLVEDLFSAVPNRDAEPAQIEEPLFGAGQLPMLLQVEPTGTLQQLQVNFAIDDYRPAYREKPLSYISNLVGHEGEGSVLSQLKAAGLAEGLGAGLGLSWRGGSMFSVSIALTDRGVQEYERVLQYLFAYLDMLRDAGAVERIYDEQAAMSALAFRFREPRPAISTVSSLSNSMHYYSDEDILRGPYLMQHFDAQLIAEALDGLRPERAQVVLTAPGVDGRSRTPYFDVPYTRLGPEAVMLSHWQPGGLDRTRAAALALPAPNPFIPEDVELRAVAEGNPEKPALRHEGDRVRVWYRQAEDFRVPKGALYVSFRSPHASDSARDVAGATLYTRMVTDALNEFTYPALLAGLGFDFYRHAQGISLRVSGYNDKQLRLLEQLLQSIQAQDFDADRFARVRGDTLRELRNSAARRPTSQVLGELREALLDTEYGDEALIAAVEATDIAALEAYREKFWNSVRAEALLYGNHAPESVSALVATLDGFLPGGAGEPALAPAVLRLGAQDLLALDADLEHKDAVVAWYLQAPEAGIEQRAAMALTAQVIESGFFQQLRTEQQLGYIVSSFAWNQYDLPGIALLIQSPSHDAETVRAAMAEFLAATPSQVDEAQFLRHRAALINRILKPHENLSERAEFYWQAIAFREWGFDRPQQLAAALERIEFRDWQEYFRSYLLEAPRSLIGYSAGAAATVPAVSESQRYNDAKVLREAVGEFHPAALEPL